MRLQNPKLRGRIVTQQFILTFRSQAKFSLSIKQFYLMINNKLALIYQFHKSYIICILIVFINVLYTNIKCFNKEIQTKTSRRLSKITNNLYLNALISSFDFINHYKFNIKYRVPFIFILVISFL